jgi:hypothetical protein
MAEIASTAAAFAPNSAGNPVCFTGSQFCGDRAARQLPALGETFRPNDPATAVIRDAGAESRACLNRKEVPMALRERSPDAHPAVVGAVRALRAAAPMRSSEARGKQIAERHGLCIRSKPAPDGALLVPVSSGEQSGTIIEPAATSAPG